MLVRLVLAATRAPAMKATTAAVATMIPTVAPLVGRNTVPVRGKKCGIKYRSL